MISIWLASFFLRRTLSLLARAKDSKIFCIDAPAGTLASVQILVGMALTIASTVISPPAIKKI